jgi:RNA polymerase sigma factor (sigma-70 family)
MISNEADWAAASSRAYRGLLGLGARAPDAEDAVQDALEQVLRLKDAAAIERPEAWLYVVASRRWKRRRWRARLFEPLSAFLGSREDGLDGAVSRIVLLAALRTLTSREREVLVARYWIGLTEREVGEALGIARGTVAAINHRATRRLRELLRDEDD